MVIIQFWWKIALEDVSMADDLLRYRRNLQKETDGAFLYRALARLEKDPSLAALYDRLAEAEERHAAFWAEKLRQAGVLSLPTRPGWRARLLVRLAAWFGSAFILPTVVGLEQSDRQAYRGQPEAETQEMSLQEQSHARLLSMAQKVTMSGPLIARLEGRHRAATGNALRAAVLGANDGLVSIFSLVMGVAGANLAARDILIAGLAGLLAGAASMAMGEWLSVQSSRELYQHQLAIEKEELENLPEEEAEELSLIYQAKGLSEAQARQMAQRLLADPQIALETLAREELGIDPEELGGSALEAAAASFFLFAVGALFPLLPFVFLSGSSAIYASIAFSVLGLFLIGAAITLFTGRPVLYSALRQVLIGLAAAALTYGIGRLVGVNV